jgi:hypothetical protein
MEHRANPAQRSDVTKRTIRVQLVCRPFGRKRETGPSLRDLRDFVEACDGLPDDLGVNVDKGHMGEDGRYNVTLSVRHEVGAE